MIFPKLQMQIENEGSSLLKGQAIQLIIELYLKRRRDEDIEFLKKNFGTTSELVKSIGSCMQVGLTSEQAQNNKFTYGQNDKKAPSKCFSLVQCLKRQFLTFYSTISLILAFIILIICSLKGLSEVQESSITIIVLIVLVSLLRTLTHYFWSRKLKNISVDKTKNQFYQVMRNGVHMQIKQSQIVVGDVVELGFKQRVPATGVILSPNQIFVKENRKIDSTQPKLNLEGCLKKIENMSDLDLKICYQNSNLPSPIIIRGSQLLKGRIYSILVISVTDEQLLTQFNYQIDDKFSSKSIDKWMAGLTINWDLWVVIIGLLSVLFLLLQQFVQFKMIQKNSKLQMHFLYEFSLKFSVLLFILNPSFLLSFIDSIYLKFMSQLKIFENFETLFMLKRIIFNERSIVEEDKIDGVQIIVGSKPDIISLSELSIFSDTYLRRLKEATDAFSINMPDYLFGFNQSRKNKRLVHVNSKKMKIISIFYECQQNWQKNRGPLKPIMLGNNSGRTEQNKMQKNMKEMSLLNNRNILKIACVGQRQDKENLKQIINLRCKIKSKAIIDGLVGLAENGLKTFYLIAFDSNCFAKITHINVQGQQKIFTIEQKQKMITLSKKMELVYNITPIILAYSYGAYSTISNRTLIGILGVHVKHNDQMMQSLSELSELDIKSIVIKDRNEQLEDKSRIQMQKIIGDEYSSRGCIAKEEICQIVECCSIRNTFGRLICRQCLIQRCDCKEKVEEVSNIQPFLQVCDRIKIIYNVDTEDVKYLESAYKQLYRHTLLVDSNKIAATDLISSIFCCLNFAQKLRRSLLSFYCITAVYFFESIICWVSNQEFVSPTQIAVSFAVLSSFYFLGCLFDIQGQLQKGQVEQKGKVRLIQKDKMIKSFFVCAFILVCCQLFQAFHYLIPEQVDRYSEYLQKQKLNISKCKFGPNNSISIKFQLYDCQTSQFGFQYSRFSTFIITYLYFSLWLFILTLHRNFKSMPSLICYACSLITFLVFIQLIPSIIHTYSYGLTSIHYCIISLSSIVSVVTGYIIGHFAGKIKIVQYFLQQIKSCISFQQQKNNYIDKLKVYYQRKKWLIDASRQESFCQFKDNI